MVKDLEYYRLNCEENLITTPISVLRYISELKKEVERVKEITSELRDIAWDGASCDNIYTRINELVEEL